MRNFLLVVPLVLLLIARLITGWIRRPTARLLLAGGVAATLVIGLADQQLNKANPRLFDFRGAIQDIKADAGPRQPRPATSRPTCGTCWSTTRRSSEASRSPFP